MRFAVYLRVSTDQQADTGQGLEIQEAACRAWLKSGGHKLVEVCSDAGRSGSADVMARPGLMNALALTTSTRVDGLLVSRLDRLARDLILQETILADLHRQGRALRSCSPTEDAHLEDDPDDPTRALVRQILGSVAAFERQTIRLRLRAGVLRKRASGGYVGGPPRYGCQALRGELVPVEAEQAVIRQMLRLRTEGLSYRQIADALERDGVPTPSRTSSWQPDVIRRIVLREQARMAPHSPALAKAVA